MRTTIGKANYHAVLAVLVACFLSMAAYAPAALGGDAVHKARLSYHWYPEHHSAKMASLFAKECRKATDGKLDIQIFPSGQLFKIAQIAQAVSQGSVEMGGLVGVMLMRVNKNFYLTGLERFFTGFQQKRDFWEKTPEGRKQWEGIQKKLGIKVIAYIPVGPATYFSTNRPLDSIDAFKGLKARTLIPTEKYTLKQLGVSYVAVTTSEVYSALKQGMINMVSTVPSAVKAYSWWDYLKYAQLPYTFYADAYIIANEKWWSSLPADIRKVVLTDVSPRISKRATEGVMAYSNAILKEFVEKHGGHVSTLSEAEQKRFMELERTKVWPALAKNMDPGFYAAAKKFVGHE